tara:strand:+ start:856 stop:1185 length:330 start_codon:yes stop_codon:yes gene_type:complete
MSTGTDYAQAMHSLCAGKMWGIGEENTYESITWNDEGQQPTKEALDAEWTKMVAENADMKRKMDRMFAYPGIEELVVAMWEKLVETDGLTSDDIAAIQAKRVAVKKEIP